MAVNNVCDYKNKYGDEIMSDLPKQDEIRYEEDKIKKVENAKKEFEYKNKDEL